MTDVSNRPAEKAAAEKAAAEKAAAEKAAAEKAAAEKAAAEKASIEEKIRKSVEKDFQKRVSNEVAARLAAARRVEESTAVEIAVQDAFDAALKKGKSVLVRTKSLRAVNPYSKQEFVPDSPVEMTSLDSWTKCQIATGIFEICQ